MMFICKTAKFAPAWTTILKIRAIFVHQTLTEHALWDDDRKHHTNEVWRILIIFWITDISQSV